jgi:hypothetical protein
LAEGGRIEADRDANAAVLAQDEFEGGGVLGRGVRVCDAVGLGTDVDGEEAG